VQVRTIGEKASIPIAKPAGGLSKCSCHGNKSHNRIAYMLLGVDNVVNIPSFILVFEIIVRQNLQAGSRVSPPPFLSAFILSISMARGSGQTDRDEDLGCNGSASFLCLEKQAREREPKGALY